MATAGAEAGFLVNQNVPDVESRAKSPGAAQDSADACKQFLNSKRLDKVVIGAEIEACDPVVHGTSGREKDHR